MWRKQGRPELYTYHQDQKNQYGDHGVIATPMTFALDRWYAVSLQVKVNDPGATNGAVHLYIDGQPVEAQERLRLRGTGGPGTLISRFLFSTFHGGHDPSWAPRNPDGSYATVHAWFDNFSVQAGEHVRPATGS